MDFSLSESCCRDRGLNTSLYWMLQEPLAHGGLLSALAWAGVTVSKAFRRAEICTFGVFLEYAGPHLQDMAGLAATLGWRSQRIICQLLDHWRGCLTGEECHPIGDYSRGLITPNPEKQFLSFFISSILERQSGQSLKDTTGRDYRF